MKKPTRNDLDKMPYEQREKVRKKLREESPYSRHFKTPQSFGAASPVKHIPVEQYLKELKEKENGR
jgi:hypothetical protein